MQSKEFRLIAHILSEVRPDRSDHHNWPNKPWYADRLWNALVTHFCLVLSKRFPKFSESKFREACEQ